MNNELNRIDEIPQQQQISVRNLTLQKQSQKWANNTKKRDDSIIKDLFQGQLCSRITCKACGHKNHTFDNFMDLTVPIPLQDYNFSGNLDLTDCLRKFTANELMIQSGYKCVKCFSNDQFGKDLSIFRFPPVLCIQINRFQNSSGRWVKFSKEIVIPQILDMSVFGPLSQHQSKLNAQDYKLFGIIHHKGSLNSGHYFAEVMNTDSENWFKCDDSKINRINMPENSTGTPYVLFYIQQQKLKEKDQNQESSKSQEQNESQRDIDDLEMNKAGSNIFGAQKGLIQENKSFDQRLAQDDEEQSKNEWPGPTLEELEAETKKLKAKRDQRRFCKSICGERVKLDKEWMYYGLLSHLHSNKDEYNRLQAGREKKKKEVDEFFEGTILNKLFVNKNIPCIIDLESSSNQNGQEENKVPVNIVQGKKKKRSKKKNNQELDEGFEENVETFKEKLEKVLQNLPEKQPKKKK